MTRGLPSGRGKSGSSEAPLGRTQRASGRRNESPPPDRAASVPAPVKASRRAVVKRRSARAYTARRLPSGRGALSDAEVFWELSSDLFAVLDEQGRFVVTNPAWGACWAGLASSSSDAPSASSCIRRISGARPPCASAPAAARAASRARRAGLAARTAPTAGCCGRPTTTARTRVPWPRRSRGARRPRHRGKRCALEATRPMPQRVRRRGSGTCGVDAWPAPDPAPAAPRMPPR